MAFTRDDTCKNNYYSYLLYFEKIVKNGLKLLRKFVKYLIASQLEVRSPVPDIDYHVMLRTDWHQVLGRRWESLQSINPYNFIDLNYFIYCKLYFLNLFFQCWLKILFICIGKLKNTSSFNNIFLFTKNQLRGPRIDYIYVDMIYYGTNAVLSELGEDWLSDSIPDFRELTTQLTPCVCPGNSAICTAPDAMGSWNSRHMKHYFNIIIMLS